MIRSRRRVHAQLFWVLTLVLPIFFAVAIARRPDVPIVGASAAPLLHRAAYAGGPPSGAAGESRFDAQIVSRMDAPTVLLLRPRTPVLRPDTLLYWSSSPVDGAALPTDAVLIGHLAGDSTRELVLPGASSQSPGSVILYSLGHQAIVDTLSLADVPTSPAPER